MSVQLLQGVRAVFFDAVGTLLAPDPPAHAVYAEAAQRYGLKLPEDIRSRFANAFQAEEEADRQAGWQTSEIREPERWRRIVAHVLDTPDTRIFDDLWKHFARPEAWRLVDGAAQILQSLRGRQLLLGIASNFDRRLHNVVAGFPELSRIGTRLISSEIGWRKPSPRFFDAVVTAAGCAADEILFIGDSRENDYDGARAAGLRAVLLDDAGTAAESIRALTELI